jgi:hypothetical protein
MSSTPTWKYVAAALAERMQYHNYCDDHREITPDCPFCDDRAAYALYVAKARQPQPKPIGTTLPIHEVPADESTPDS